MSKHNIKIPPIGLTFSRDQMPQLGPKEGFLANLQKHKIKFHKVTIDSKDLKSSQGEFNKDAIASLMIDPKTSKSAIVISKDNYVLDGHHRWAANYNNDENYSESVCYYYLGDWGGRILDVGHHMALPPSTSLYVMVAIVSMAIDSWRY